MITPEKQNKLEGRMRRLGIFEPDLEEQFIRGTGHGGQKINKTSSTVLLRHIPTGIVVRCQASRSQVENRFFARRLLADKIEAQILGKRSVEQQQREKIRRQKRKRSKRAKEKMLQTKHHRSKILANRQVSKE
ncbi:MAG: peptide chain release factor-like protein [Deltaproteobacteria bacterium]|nr:peptide chain release factor-like protein [Deltaproteobacteria bacterium]